MSMSIYLFFLDQTATTMIDELRSRLMSHLAPVFVPSIILTINEFPHTESGKVYCTLYLIYISNTYIKYYIKYGFTFF